jgi:hypothetical protein
LCEPLTAPILVVADQFLLLRVYRYDRITGAERVFHGAVDIPKLCVAIRVILTLLGFAVALQTVTTLLQQLRHFGMTHR